MICYQRCTCSASPCSVVARCNAADEAAFGLSVQLLPSGTRVVRVMPNTPALVGCGASVFAPNEHATEADCKLVSSLLSAVG